MRTIELSNKFINLDMITHVSIGEGKWDGRLYVNFVGGGPGVSVGDEDDVQTLLSALEYASIKEEVLA